MNEFVPLVARVVVGAVLIFAAVAKVRSTRWSVLALEMGTPRIVITTLPTVEALIGLALVLQVGGGATAWAAIVMFTAFTVVVIRQYASGSQIPCNCFGAAGGEQAVSKLTIIRNLALLAVALVAAL